MKDSNDSIGTLIYNHQHIKKYTRYISPFRVIGRTNSLVSIIIFATGGIVCLLGDQHTTVTILIICYIVTVFVGILLDFFDDRVYVSKQGYAIKSKGITKKYEWKHLKQVQLLPDNSIVFELVNNEIVIVKNIMHTKNLMYELNQYTQA